MLGACNVRSRATMRDDSLQMSNRLENNRLASAGFALQQGQRIHAGFCPHARSVALTHTEYKKARRADLALIHTHAHSGSTSPAPLPYSSFSRLCVTAAAMHSKPRALRPMCMGSSMRSSFFALYSTTAVSPAFSSLPSSGWGS